MKHLLTNLVLVIMVTACSSDPGKKPDVLTGTINPSDINTSTPNQTPTSSIFLEYPKATLSADAEIYQGPGNLDYEVLTTLRKGQVVNTIGFYGDFVKIYEPESKSEGFIDKKILPPLANDVTALTYQDVPWITEDLTADYFSGPFTTIDQNHIATIQNYITGPGNYSPEGASIPLGQEAHIIIQMETSNSNSVSIELKDRQKIWSNGEQDEWYFGYNALMITWNPDKSSGWYSLDFRDGQKDHTFSIPLRDLGKGPFDLVILGSTGTAIEVRDMEGNVIRHFDTSGEFFFEGVTVDYPNGVFPDNVVYPVLTSMGPTTITSTVHILERTPIGLWQTPATELADLRDLAQKNGIDIIIPVEGWRLANTQYSNIAQTQVTMDYSSEPLSIVFWEAIDHYNFEFLDTLIDYKTSRGWKIMFNIVYGWGGDNPTGNPPDLISGNFTKQEYIDILHDYVTSIACRYKDKVTLWQIASESPGMRDYPEADFWLKRIGPEYVDLSFQWVRDCDPDGQLMLVDTFDSPRSTSMTYRLESTYTMAKNMIDKGVPIDAVGLEGHMFLPWDAQSVPIYEEVLLTMKRFTDLGLDIYITEMDVNLLPFEGTQEEKWQFQADIYKMMLDACLDTGRCKGFGIYGIDDKHSWANCPGSIDTLPAGYCLPTTQADPLWFDGNFNPKPAYWAIVQSLEDHLK